MLAASMAPSRAVTDSDECFVLHTGYAEERGRTIVTREGLMIEMADDYSSQGVDRDGRYEDPSGNSFCLNDEGHARSAS